MKTSFVNWENAVSRERAAIVFENRNKGFGAYVIRHEYERSVLISILLSSFLFCLVVVYPLIKNKYFKDRITYEIPDDGIGFTDISTPPPIKPLEPLIIPQTVIPRALLTTLANTIPTIVSDEIDPSRSMSTQEQLSNAPNTGEETINGNPGITTNPNINISPVTEITENTTIYTPITVERTAEYIDGMEKLNSFLSSQINYPEDAIAHNIKGNVAIEFVVEKDGSVSNIKVLKDIGAGCGEEAIRVLSLTKWKPAIQNGNKVRQKMTIPVFFRILE